MKIFPTVSVFVPAYNEEANIGNLLSSLLKQQKSNFNLKNITVYSDGSTDRTDLIVRKISRNHPLVKLNSFSVRRGKVARLNQIYRANKSDFLFIFDADIKLGSELLMSHLVEGLVNQPKIQLIAAHQIPIRPKTFIGKAIYGGYRVWDDTRLSVPGYDHIQNFYGAASIYRKDFAKGLSIPADITDERGYIYLRAKQAGGFNYLKTECIYYLPVSTLHDFFKLANRSFLKNENALVKYFGQSVTDYYHLPLNYKLKSIFSNFLKDPLFTCLGLFLNMVTRIIQKKDQLYEQGMWEISTSTKRYV